MFKRRTPLGFGRLIAEVFWPRSGWRRASTYIMHRVRRLPDQPQRIARGVAAGVFVSFTPLFGFHLLAAMLIAWAVRGNILAACLGTLFGNPVTMPIIAITSVELGNWMLGLDGRMTAQAIMSAFSRVTVELWQNFIALFTGELISWTYFRHAYDRIFIPYLLGGIIPGIVVALIIHRVTLFFITAYQKRRAKKLRARAELLRAAAARRLRHGSAGVPPADPNG